MIKISENSKSLQSGLVSVFNDDEEESKNGSFKKKNSKKFIFEIIRCNKRLRVKEENKNSYSSNLISVFADDSDTEKKSDRKKEYNHQPKGLYE